METTSLVEVDVRAVGAGAVAIVTLNDPSRRNMLSAAMVEGIVSAFDSLEAGGEVGAVVVTGAPPAFCAGADLGDLSSAGSAPASATSSTGKSLTSIYEGFLRVARCSLPTVAAVNGPAVGAGMNLALACDLRIVGARGRFECRFAEIGLHPGGGHTWMLEHLVGKQTAAAMVLFSQAIRGEDAVGRGLAYGCVEDDLLLTTALDVAGKAAQVPLELAKRMKKTLREAPVLAGHDEAISYELEAQLWSVSQPFFAERIEALRSRIANK